MPEPENVKPSAIFTADQIENRAEPLRLNSDTSKAPEFMIVPVDNATAAEAAVSALNKAGFETPHKAKRASSDGTFEYFVKVESAEWKGIKEFHQGIESAAVVTPLAAAEAGIEAYEQRFDDARAHHFSLRNTAARDQMRKDPVVIPHQNATSTKKLAIRRRPDGQVAGLSLRP